MHVMNEKIRLTWLLLSFVLFLAACSTPTPEPTATVVAIVAPTPTPLPATAIPTVAPTSIPTATLTPLPPTPTATPTPALVQLTSGGCCAQPFWSPDSKSVMFIDKPNAQAQTGIYRVSIDAPGQVALVTPKIANYTSDFKYTIGFEGQSTVVTRIADGVQWKLATGARNVILSPDRTQAVWNQTAETYPFENRLTTVMLASLGPNGETDARKLTTVLRGGANAWLDNNRLVMNGRLTPGSEAVTLYVYDLKSGNTYKLVTSEHLRSTSPSPDGKWIAYTIVFDKNADQNGTWLVPTDGAAAPRKLDWFGPFQWQGSQQLIYLPLEVGVSAHTFYQYDLAMNKSRPLDDPARTPFKIGNGDWAVSPDGQGIVFVGAQDGNLWLLNFGR